MSTKTRKLSASYLIHCVIGFFLVFGFGFFPPFATLTPLGMKVLGIFIGTIYLWSFLEILWPSLMGLIALGLSGYGSSVQVMKDAFGDNITVMVLFGMILFGAIQEVGITEYISRWFLTRKIINGRPMVFSFIFIFCTYVLAALSASILPSILFMWAILYGVLQDVGYKKGEKYTSLMVIGTYIGAMVGHGAKPFVATGLILTGAYTGSTGREIDYLQYMSFGVVIAVLCIILYVMLMKFVFKPDTSKIANISTDQFDQNELPPFNPQQKILTAVLILFMVLMLLPSVLPKSWGIIIALNTIGNTGIAIGLVAILCMIHIDKKPVMNIKSVITKYVAWDVYFLVAMVMVMGNALTSEGTGVNELLVQVLGPVLGGKSPFVFTAILIVFAVVVTNFANNTVVGVMMIPVIYSFSVQNGANADAVATIVFLALHWACITPAASVYSCVLHGNTEWVDTKDVVKYTSIFIACSIVVFILCIPVVNLIFA